MGLLSLIDDYRCLIDEFFFNIDCFFFSFKGVLLLSFSYSSPFLNTLSLRPSFCFSYSVITKLEFPKMLCELVSLSESLWTFSRTIYFCSIEFLLCRVWINLPSTWSVPSVSNLELLLGVIFGSGPSKDCLLMHDFLCLESAKNPDLIEGAEALRS